MLVRMLLGRGGLAAVLVLAGLQVPPEGVAALKRIYEEVRTMPSPPGQGFLRQDVFIGGPDDDDTNKDVHVALLIQRIGDEDRMHVQITSLERSEADRRVKRAAGSRALLCAVRDGALRLVRSDVADDEIARLAADILKAVLDKKRLIRAQSAEVPRGTGV
jgi:hypothetical protein